MLSVFNWTAFSILQICKRGTARAYILSKGGYRITKAKGMGAPTRKPGAPFLFDALRSTNGATQIMAVRKSRANEVTGANANPLDHLHRSVTLSLDGCYNERFP